MNLVDVEVEDQDVEVVVDVGESLTMRKTMFAPRKETYEDNSWLHTNIFLNEMHLRWKGMQSYCYGGSWENMVSNEMV